MGKTEFISQYLMDQDFLIFDGTLLSGKAGWRVKDWIHGCPLVSSSSSCESGLLTW
jgi:hypothetical protein